MRQILVVGVLLGFISGTLGCGSGGGMMSEAEMKRRSRKRLPQPEEPIVRPAAKVAKAATPAEKPAVEKQKPPPVARPQAASKPNIAPPDDAKLPPLETNTPPGPPAVATQAPPVTAPSMPPLPETPPPPAPVAVATAPAPPPDMTAKPATPPASPPNPELAASPPAIVVRQETYVTPEDFRTIVPDQKELLVAREKLREVYRSDYESVRTSQDRSRLAKKLMADSIHVDASPADFHEIVRVARDLAVSAGDAPTALAAVQALGQRFKIDALELRAQMIEDMAKPNSSLANSTKLREEAARLVREGFDADRFDIALRVTEIEQSMARAKGDRPGIARIGQQKQLLESAKAAYMRVPAAKLALQMNLNDPQASEILGEYLCLVKARWPAGLPLLAQGANLRMKLLARLDLEPAKTPQEILELADEYWQLGEDAKLPQQFGYRLRAGYWYLQAAKVLPPSLDKVRAQKRYEEIAEYYGQELLDRLKAEETATAVSLPRPGSGD